MEIEKQQIRSKYKQLRTEIPRQNINSYSQIICKKLTTIPIWHCHIFHIFMSIKHQKEVCTNPIIKLLKHQNKTIIIPKSDFKALQMNHFLLEEQSLLENNHLGIPEPKNGQKVNPKNIEVVFVPLLAFDKNGNRIGYGKGFYDRFLKSCKTNTIKIGLSFFEAEDFVPCTQNDIALNYCITPKTTYKFKNITPL